MTDEERCKCGLGPNERTILPPEGGWRECTFYVVDVALSPANCVHRAIFYTGFLNGLGGGPGGYNALMNPTYDTMLDDNPYRTVHYLKAVRVLGDRLLNEVK